ncbi:unnamed protein product [Chrysoparadoxa australica]
MRRALLRRPGGKPYLKQAKVAYGTRLWEPSPKRIAGSKLTRFAKTVSHVHGQDLTKWEDLHKWSIISIGPFWQAVADFCGIKWAQRGEGPPCILPSSLSSMQGTQWFPGALLNFAENLMPPPNDAEVLVCVGEGRERPAISLTGCELHRQVARCAAAMDAMGLAPGDRVAGVLPNAAEALVCMLAATSRGLVWCSCSPDFGAQGVLDRLGQVEPKLVFFTEGYYYAGKWVDCLEAIDPVLDQLGNDTRAPLEAVSSHHLSSHCWLSSAYYNSATTAPPGYLPQAVLVPYWGNSVASHPRTTPYAEFTQSTQEVTRFVPLPFNHPVYIMFSSGTTGMPKCIVHGAGGTLLQQRKELELHCDLGTGDALCFFTTTGWMMWQWAAAGLGVAGAKLVTYEGSPAYPNLGALWDTAARHEVTHLGTSPKHVKACMDAQSSPSAAESGLTSLQQMTKLKALLSTGAPLMPEQFEWVYQSIKHDLHLASITGGTDIMGCFALGNPNLPVWSGELQGPGLGMDVAAMDVATGEAVVGARAELVCKSPFPSMPVGFWGDESGESYHKAYFRTVPDPASNSNSNGTREVWLHGDFIEVTPRGGIIVHGRSDATLNPGGVRIGTADLYRHVEKMDEVDDCVACGYQVAGETVVVLIIKLHDPSSASEGSGFEADENLARKVIDALECIGLTEPTWVKALIRRDLTPRHVPAYVLTCSDIPYTRSGKKVEMAVTRLINGGKIDNEGAIHNAECLRHFREMGTWLKQQYL